MKFKKYMLVGSLLFTSTLLSVVPVSADWEGNVVSERPTGQALAAGFADADGVMMTGGFGVGVVQNWFVDGSGVVTVSVYQANGMLIVEETAAGPDLRVSVTTSLFGRLPAQEYNVNMQVIAPGQEVVIENLVQLPAVAVGTRVFVSLTGVFRYSGVPRAVVGRASYEFRVNENCTIGSFCP